MRILAIDLGTSSVKFMRLDERARVLSVDRVPMAGLDVDDWLMALQRDLSDHGDHDEVGGIAITGQMHGLMTREDGGSWGVGIPWHDQRSAALIPEIRALIGQDATTDTGGPIAPGFLAASLVWIGKHDPARWRRIRSVHLPKDALVHELTGEHLTDPSDAAGTALFAPGSGDWAWPVVEALGIPREWLPGLIPSGSIAGGLRPEYAGLLRLPAGLPIITAGGDSPVGTYGAGVMREGEALVMLSTGAQVTMPARAWSPDPAGHWYTWPSVAPESSSYAPFLETGTLLNAGNVAAWTERLFAGNDIRPVSSGLVALPHLIGTREDPAWRGAILGMTERTTAVDIRRALIEGVAFSVRSKMASMTGMKGAPARVRLGGGLAHRADVRQLFADVLGRPIETVAQPELTAYGAGLLALQTLTGFVPEDAILTGAVTDPGRVEEYEVAYALYREVESALAPLEGRIASLRNRDT